LAVITVDLEEENNRINILIQHIADNTRLGQGGKLRQDVKYFTFFMPNAIEGAPRILHICFNEALTQNEKQIIQKRFPGLAMAR
jgi:hypothetical protein